VETRLPLALHSLHELRLTLGERSIVLKGRVAHSRMSDVDQEIVTYLSGIEFIELSERARTVIGELLETLKAIAAAYSGHRALSRFQILEIVTGFDARCRSKGRIVKVRPSIHDTAVGQRHRSNPARVHARVGLGRTVAFVLVERLKHGGRIVHLVELTADTGVLRGNRPRIGPKIEEYSRNAPAAFEREGRIDTTTPGAVQRRHERSVKED
jgi:hypothetical protein